MIKVVLYNAAGTTVDIHTNKDFNLRWEFRRNGGCGRACLDSLIEMDTSDQIHNLAKKWGMKIYIPGDTGDYELRYDGFVTHSNRYKKGSKQGVRAMFSGYSAQLDRSVITSDFVATEPPYRPVNYLIKDLLDTYIIPNTTITYDNSYVTGAFNVTALKMKHNTVGRMIKLMALLQGATEWGVNANRQFYFVPVSAAVNNIEVGGRDMSQLYKPTRFDPLANRLRLSGGIKSDYTFYSQVANDGGAQGACGIRELDLSVPAIVSATEGNQLTTNLLAITAYPIINVACKKVVKDSRFFWYDYQQPVDKFAVISRGLNITASDSYYLKRVIYSIQGRKRNILLELENVFNSQEEVTNLI